MRKAAALLIALAFPAMTAVPFQVEYLAPEETPKKVEEKPQPQPADESLSQSSGKGAGLENILMPDTGLILTALDAPFFQDSNAVWCPSANLMWEALRRNVTHGPVQIVGGCDFADRMNLAPNPERDMPAGSFYAEAGFATELFLSRIQRDMQRKFPEHPVSAFPLLSPKDIIGYSYLNRRILFSRCFDDLANPLLFKEAKGMEIPVRSFGAKMDFGCPQRSNVKVLWFKRDGTERGISECAVCLDDVPGKDEVVVALVDVQGTLEERYRYVCDQIGNSKGSVLLECDSLEIPNVSFAVTRMFPEVLGRTIRVWNGTNRVVGAFREDIRFDLDRNGVKLESEVLLATIGIPEQRKHPQPRDFRFDRPFLLYMKKRGAERPYFVMWVANAELLCKWPAAEK